MNIRHGTHAFALLGLLAAAPGCATESTDAESDTQELASKSARGVTRWWEGERADRQAELDAYLADKAEAFDKFRSMPAGTIGVPTIVFRLLPHVLPQAWGPPESNFAVLGLAPDAFDPDAVLPMGLGHISGATPIPTPQGPVHMRVVGLTCATCHAGRVQLEDGSIQPLIGAPAGEFKFHLYRALMAYTVNHPSFTAESFLAALDARPLGWLYNDPSLLAQEAIERAVFALAAPQLLAALKADVNAKAAHAGATLGAHTYGGPNAPSLTAPHPGQMEAIGGYASMTLDPATMSPAFIKSVLPPKPAIVDQMYVWSAGDRPSTKIGGEVPNHTFSLAGAAMGMIGDPRYVNMDAVNASVDFTWSLPPAPYPFAVERSKAARGRRLFEQNCAGCHAPGNENLLTPAEVGTDPNRAAALTDFTVAGLRQLLRIACSDPVTCRDADGNPLPDDRVIRKTGAYAALPLDGIWARAPYLHNGSVPTLRALLTGDRPTTFYRGNISYDQENIGFTWDRATSPHASVYDTTVDGNSNVGHDSAEFTGGIDWANEPRKLEALLEYMKTL